MPQNSFSRKLLLFLVCFAALLVFSSSSEPPNNFWIMSSAAGSESSFFRTALPYIFGLIGAIIAFFLGNSLAKKNEDTSQKQRVLLVSSEDSEHETLARMLPSVPLSAVKHLDEVANFQKENPDIGMVSLSTQELANYYNEAAKKRDYLLLREKMEAMGSLSAGVAHEVANPIGFVTVSTENMQADLENFKDFLFSMVGEDADEEVVESFKSRLIPLSSHLDIILDGCERIRGITRELQAFARCSPGKARKVVLMDLVENMVAFAKTRFKRRATFAVTGDATAQVMGRSAELNQVFYSILLNATQAIVRDQEDRGDRTPGKIRINIASRAELIEIQFSDDGPGIEPHLLATIFEPGYSTREDGGTGMGLTVARRVIEDHNGRLTLNSQVGEGTVVNIILPMAKEE